ncbi:MULTISPECIES: DUF4898 domain-containing protein [Metallosphaera]|uniref:DUF4898 domain-containing protein n=3 Tax=Metallosphaera TaxID=41980 RepID=A4YGK1_METS5|nr:MULTISPECIES: DUF4898 domain-containing protein [Metallosphaera]ABP95553.1 hypothetical protein Msed_1395 [Metallosphaera sedula DSM 5348]AIM27537.1 hypothetical protein HA72_1395 [Metallosphaera sedula]AKV74399.1 hypothetical protein MsedA_1413 [Metallosphaera sedula]AKV76638.1 hypothetical protein MsedB_1415 [Metallosphaera sedula]AKV78890.1 hypothetical protein MsedC_1413 [Metallosphaera sedula]
MMADIMARGGNEQIEPELLEVLISSFRVNSTPKKIPMKAVSNLGKMLSLILPKNVEKIVIVVSKDYLGSEKSFVESTKSIFPSASVNVLFSHKLDQDSLLVYFK